LALSDAVTDRRNEVSVEAIQFENWLVRPVVSSRFADHYFLKGSPSGAHRRSSLVR
jgi:hypothetical protein